MLGSDPGRVPGGVSLDNWQAAPYLHWSFQHVAELLPTATISRGTGPVAILPNGIHQCRRPESVIAAAVGRSTSDRRAP